MEEESSSWKLRLLEPVLQVLATVIFWGILFYEEIRPYTEKTYPYIRRAWSAARFAARSAVGFCRWQYRWLLNPLLKLAATFASVVLYIVLAIVVGALRWYVEWCLRDMSTDPLYTEPRTPLLDGHLRLLNWASGRITRPAVHTVFKWTDLTLRWGSVALIAFMSAKSVHYIYWDRSAMPDMEPFVKFEPPTIGHIYDAKGETFVELAKEYRSIVEYKDIPEVMVQATLATEDKRFFRHGGLDYLAWPRIVFKFLVYSFAATNDQYDKEKRIWPPKLIFPQGGSTLTQQLVRNYFLQEMIREESRGTLYKFKRKVQEARLSLWLEEELPVRLERYYGWDYVGNADDSERRPHFERMAKEMIFSRYASFVYAGNGRYGFAATSELLFSKKLSEFTPDDAEKAALIAGIIKSPHDYAPRWDSEKRVWVNLERPKRRRNEILMLMYRRGYITQEQCTEMQARELGLVKRPEMKTDAPAVVEHALEEVKKNKSETMNLDQLYEGKIQVTSTSLKEIQSIANAALEQGLHDYEDGVKGTRPGHPEAKGKVQGSVIVLRNRDGAILAEVGGRQFYKDKYATFNDYNRVTDSRRQPGSAFKPFVYLTAIRSGMNLETTVVDAPIFVRMGGGQLHWIDNYDKKSKGAISLRKALAESRNQATTWIWYRVGNDAMLESAKLTGITSKLKREPSTALGASEVTLMELTNAYRAIASGIYARPYIVHEVLSGDGKTLYKSDGKTRPLAIEPAHLALMQEGLRGVVRIPGGTAYWSLSGLCAGTPDPKKGCTAENRIPVMGKTGTTTDFKDAIFVGSTYGPDGITIGVRIGFDNPGMGYDEDGQWGLGPKRGLGSKETGGRTAIPIFREIMSRVYADKLAGPIPQFPEEIEHNIDVYLGNAVPDPEEEEAPAPVPSVQPPVPQPN